MSLPLIPHIRVPVVGASVCADPWYTWFQAVQRQVAVSVDVDTLISEIATKLGSPDGSIAGIPTPSDATGNVLGLKSLQSFSTLAEGQVTLTLRGDVSVPGATEYYGSDATGQRGWHAVSDAMAQGVGLTLTVGEDGVTTFDLADLADSGAGTFKLLARDAQGRLSGTADGDTDDVPEGAGNLYYTDARADGRITAQKGVAGGLATLDGSSKLDAGQLPALAITETSVVADEAAMLALTAQQGDVAVRTDVQTSFILTAEPASTLANWQELLTPTAGAVTSFNGRTGAVVPASGDYTAAQVGADPAGTAAAIVAATITNGDTTHAPSGDAVADALAGKADGAGVTVSSGTYTPTWTAVSNVSAFLAHRCQWLRVGSVVTVSGRVDVTATAAGILTQISATIPIASTFASANEGCGTASSRSQTAQVIAVGTSVQMEWSASTTANTGYFFTFTYLVK